jgi:hypothetical protein
LALRGAARVLTGTAQRFGRSKIRIRYQGVEEPLVRILVVEDHPKLYDSKATT